jgi:hypothetical protein
MSKAITTDPSVNGIKGTIIMDISGFGDHNGTGLLDKLVICMKDDVIVNDFVCIKGDRISNFKHSLHYYVKLTKKMRLNAACNSIKPTMRQFFTNNKIEIDFISTEQIYSSEFKDMKNRASSAGNISKTGGQDNWMGGMFTLEYQYFDDSCTIDKVQKNPEDIPIDEIVIKVSESLSSKNIPMIKEFGIISELIHLKLKMRLYIKTGITLTNDKTLKSLMDALRLKLPEISGACCLLLDKTQRDDVTSDDYRIIDPLTTQMPFPLLHNMMIQKPCFCTRTDGKTCKLFMLKQFALTTAEGRQIFMKNDFDAMKEKMPSLTRDEFALVLKEVQSKLTEIILSSSVQKNVKSASSAVEIVAEDEIESDKRELEEAEKKVEALKKKLKIT